LWKYRTELEFEPGAIHVAFFTFSCIHYLITCERKCTCKIRIAYLFLFKTCSVVPLIISHLSSLPYFSMPVAFFATHLMCFCVFKAYSNVFVQLHAVERPSVSNIMMSQGFRNSSASTRPHTGRIIALLHCWSHTTLMLTFGGIWFWVTIIINRCLLSVHSGLWATLGIFKGYVLWLLPMSAFLWTCDVVSEDVQWCWNEAHLQRVKTHAGVWWEAEGRIMKSLLLL